MEKKWKTKYLWGDGSLGVGFGMFIIEVPYNKCTTVEVAVHGFSEG